MDEYRSGSDAEDGSKAFVDVVDQYVGQPASLFSEERPVDQLEPERNSDRVFRQPACLGGKQHIPSDARSTNIRSDWHDVGLPDIHTEHIVGGDHHTRPPFVEIDPVHPAPRYHGAERSIRSNAANDSATVGGSVFASSASASNCWAKPTAEWVAA